MYEPTYTCKDCDIEWQYANVCYICGEFGKVVLESDQVTEYILNQLYRLSKRLDKLETEAPNETP